jgi:hypothetical protein
VSRSTLLGGGRAAQAGQDDRAVQRTGVSFEQGAHGVEVAALSLFDQPLLLVELDRCR